MRILFIDTTHALLLDQLEMAGFDCDYKPTMTHEEFLASVGKYEGLVLRSRFPIDKTVLDKATRLKAIGRVGAGLENIDVQYARKLGIACLNVPEGNRDAVGEHALGLLLMLLNHMYRLHTEVCNGLWRREENRGTEIKGKTVGIIGYGNMGNAFAQRLAGFEAEVLAYDKYKIGYGNLFAREASLEQIFEKADILSLHVPLTEETRFMVNAEFLARFRKDIWLVNTARGKVVQTSDLVAALQSGKVLGAALDVLEYEKSSFENLHRSQLPKEFEYLISADNVLLSPHVAGWTHESNRKLAYYTAEKLIGALLGRKAQPREI